MHDQQHILAQHKMNAWEISVALKIMSYNVPDAADISERSSFKSPISIPE